MKLSISVLALSVAAALAFPAHAGPASCESLATLVLPGTSISVAAVVPAGGFDPPGPTPPIDVKTERTFNAMGPELRAFTRDNRHGKIITGGTADATSFECRRPTHEQHGRGDDDCARRRPTRQSCPAASAFVSKRNSPATSFTLMPP
jgi:hypothetical protein